MQGSDFAVVESKRKGFGPSLIRTDADVPRDLVTTRHLNIGRKQWNLGWK
jgi:hypothetical protein